jgi:ABC-2 type transport system ATP-binding protein
MNGEANVSQQGEQVRRLIRDDVQGAFAALVAYANANAVTSTLKHEALLLKFNQREHSSPAEFEAVGKQMLDLVDRIETDHRERWRIEDVQARERAFEKIRAEYLARASDPVFVGKGLGKHYRRTDFHLRGVDLELRPGEVTALVGQNAHGKTTLLRIVAGELRADEGTLTFPSLSQMLHIDWTLVKAHVAYLPQELPPWHGALRDNLHYEAAIHGILGEDNEREVEFFIERLGLREHLHKRWSQLSGGTKLRFALARVLVWKPKLLVLDEPLANLDVRAQSRLLQDLLDLARSARYPQAVLMSSQHLHELEAVASAIVFLRGGEVVFNGPVEEIGRERLYNAYELGTSADIATLKDLFRDPHVEEPFHNGVSFVIKTGKEVGAREVLRKLEESGIDVVYFRDISRSIKQFFE